MIESGANWKNSFDKGNLISMLVISKEDIEKLYSPKQAAGTIEYIEGIIKSEL